MPAPHPNERSADSLEHLLADSRWVERLALKLVGDPAVAADLSQEALAAALRDGPSERARLEPWLAGVVRNLARRWKRDSARRASHARDLAARRPDALPSTEELLAQAELRRIVAEEAEHLAEPYRTAVFLRYFKGLEPSEIAREQGVPAGTVRSRLTRALELLRRRMDARAGGDRGAWSAVALGLLPASAAAPLAPHAPWIEAPGITGLLTMKALQIGTAAVLAGVVALGAWSLTHDASPEGVEPVAPLANTPAGPPLEPGRSEVSDAPSSTTARTAIDAPVPAATASEEPAPPPPPPPYARHGTLALFAVDTSGQGLVGARVRVAPTAKYPQKQVLWTDLDVRTGTDGLARFDVAWGARGAMHEVEVSYAGLATVCTRTRLSSERETHLGRLVLAPGGRARGTVLDTEGAPVIGAMVFATAPSGDWDDTEHTLRLGPVLSLLTPHTVSGPDGDFTLEGLEAGFARLWAKADGYLYTMTAAVEVPANGTLDGVELVLRPERAVDRIEGIVLSPAGEPLRTSLTYRWVLGNNATSSGLVSGEDGRFSLLLDARVPVTFHVMDTENRWSDFVRERVEPGTPDLVFQFEEAGHLDVRVRANGEPVPRFRVDGISERYQIDGMSIGSLTRLREDEHEGGRARMVVPGLPFRVRVKAPGYAEETLGPFDPASAPRELDFHLTPLPGVRGRVLASGAPVRGARVVLRRWIGENSSYVYSGYRFRLRDTDRSGAVRTDSEGRFSIELERAGRYSVRVLTKDHAIAELGPLDLDPRTGADDLLLEVGPGGTIEGRVLTEPGRNPAGTIVAINDGAAIPHTIRVGEDGRFRFERLQPGSWQVLEAEAELHAGSSSSSYSSGHDIEPIEWSCEVHAGATTHHNLDLRPEGEATLDGRLLLSGTPASGWTVHLADDSSRTARPGTTGAVTDARGHFTLGPVSAGRMTLMLVGPVAGSGGLTLTEPGLDLASGPNEWALDVPAGAVRGSGAPLAHTSEELMEYRWSGSVLGHDLEAHAQVAPDEDGTFALPLVLAGAGELRRWVPPAEGAGWNEWETLASFEIEAGQTYDVDLD